MNCFVQNIVDLTFLHVYFCEGYGSYSTFQSWMADTTMVAQATADVESPAATGKRIMQNIGCFACHTIDGSKLVGPRLKEFGEKNKLLLPVARNGRLLLTKNMLNVRFMTQMPMLLKVYQRINDFLSRASFPMKI